MNWSFALLATVKLKNIQTDKALAMTSPTWLFRRDTRAQSTVVQQSILASFRIQSSGFKLRLNFPAGKISIRKQNTLFHRELNASGHNQTAQGPKHH